MPVLFDDATVVAEFGTTFALRRVRSARVPHSTLAKRVQILEQKVEVLETLPTRVTAVELQIVQLREEMRDGFSAIRRELSAAIRAGDEETRRYMRVLHEEVISRIATIQEGLSPRRKT